MVLFALMMVTNLLNYGFQVGMGRMMSPEEYGTLNALLSLFMILSAVGGLFMMVAAQDTAYYHALGRDDHARTVLRALLKIAGGVGIALALAGVFLAAPIADALRVKQPLLVGITLLAVAVHSLYLVFSGVLQGLKRFVPYSVAGIIVACAKLLLGVAALALGLRLAGVLAALVLGGVMALVYCVAGIRDFWPKYAPAGRATLNRTDFLRYLNGIFWAQALTVLITNADMLLVKAFAGVAAEAGVYSAGMVIGKIALYAVGAVVAALFPLVAEASAQGRDTRPLFWRAMGYGGGAAVLCALGMNVFGRFLVRLLFGTAYLDAVPLLPPISLLVVAVTLLTLEMNYLAALKRMRFYTLTLGGGCAVLAGLVAQWHSNTAEILITMATVLYLVVGLNLVTIVRRGEPNVTHPGG